MKSTTHAYMTKEILIKYKKLRYTIIVTTTDKPPRLYINTNEIVNASHIQKVLDYVHKEEPQLLTNNVENYVMIRHHGTNIHNIFIKQYKR